MKNMKSQPKPKMAMKKTVAKDSTTAPPIPIKPQRAPVQKPYYSSESKKLQLAKQQQDIAKYLNAQKQKEKAVDLARKKQYEMARKKEVAKESARRKSIGVTGRIKEDVKKVVKGLSSSPRMRL